MCLLWTPARAHTNGTQEHPSTSCCGINLQEDIKAEKKGNAMVAIHFNCLSSPCITQPSDHQGLIFRRCKARQLLGEDFSRNRASTTLETNGKGSNQNKVN